MFAGVLVVEGESNGEHKSVFRAFWKPDHHSDLGLGEEDHRRAMSRQTEVVLEKGRLDQGKSFEILNAKATRMVLQSAITTFLIPLISFPFYNLSFLLSGNEQLIHLV